MTAGRSLLEAPRSLSSGDQWQLGVYRTPFEVAAMGARGWKRYRLKEWHYLSFTTDEWFVAVGLVQLGYVANLFAYALDRVQNKPALEQGILSPLGAALSFAPSSIRGTTSWRSRGASISVEANDGWDVELDLPLGAERLSGRARIEPNHEVEVGVDERLPRRWNLHRRRRGPPFRVVS